MGLFRTIASSLFPRDASQAQEMQPARPASKPTAPQFSFGQELKVILSEPKNYIRAIKCLYYLATSYVLQATGFILHSKSISTVATHQKLSAYHEGGKIASVWAKSKFGDQILVPSRNIGKLEEDRATGETSTLSNLFKRYKAHPEIARAIRENPKFEHELRSDFTNGVCWAASVSLLSQCLEKERAVNRSLTEEEVKAIAKEYSEGAPIDVEALYSIYDRFYFGTSTEEPIVIKHTPYEEIRFGLSNLKHYRAKPKDFDFIACVEEILSIKKNFGDFDGLVNSMKAIGIKEWCKNRYGEDEYTKLTETRKWVVSILEYYVNGKEAEKVVFGEGNKAQIFENISINVKERELHTLILNQLHLLESSAREGQGRIDSSDVSGISSEEQLQTLKDLEDGKYQITFNTGKGAHAIGFINAKEDVCYLFDPNYGLIKCGPTPKNDLLRLLSLYPPPTSQKGSNNPDYKMHVFGIKLNVAPPKEVRSEELRKTYRFREE